MPKIAIACGYASAQRVTNKEGLHSAITMARATDGVSFIEVQVRPGNRADIGRPTSTLEQNKVAMMKFLGVE